MSRTTEALAAPAALSIRAAFTVEEFRTLVVPMGRAQFYDEVKRGRIEILKDDGRTLVPADQGPKFIALLRAERDTAKAAATT